MSCSTFFGGHDWEAHERTKYLETTTTATKKHWWDFFNIYTHNKRYYYCELICRNKGCKCRKMVKVFENSKGRVTNMRLKNNTCEEHLTLFPCEPDIKDQINQLLY